MVRIPSHLKLTRYGIYHFRIAIPQDLRVHFGQREINRSLQTGNCKQAIFSARKLSTATEELFQQARLMVDGNVNNPNIGIITLKGIKSDTVKIDNIEIKADTPEEETDIAQALISVLEGNKAAQKGLVGATEEALIPLSKAIEKHTAIMSP